MHASSHFSGRKTLENKVGTSYHTSCEVAALALWLQG
eukprot:COSAG02_NODE_25370_length_660_cov_1.582888_1_plen_36_part_01